MSSSATNMPHGFTLLSDLSEADLDWILSVAKRTPVPPQTVVIQEGADVVSLYIVLNGLLHVYVGSSGREVAILGAGSIFGEMAFLEDRPASASVATTEDSELLAITRRDLDLQVQENPAFAARLYRMLARVTSQRLRVMVGTLGRWMDTEPAVDPHTLERWQAIAVRTQELKGRLIEIERDDDAEPQAAARKLQPVFTDFCLFMNKAIGDGSAETLGAREDLGARIQREILPYLMKSRTMERLYQKPRGYSGDFLTNHLLCQAKPAGHGHSGTVYDYCFLSLPLITAIGNKCRLMAEEIRRRAAETSGAPLKVAALCSGTAPELSDHNRSDRVQATLLDFDASAIGATTDRQSQFGGAPEFTLLSTNLVEIATGIPPSTVAGQDLGYTLYLMDYLDDPFAIKVLNYLHRLLKPGGSAVVWSLHVSNPYKAFMEYILGWKVAHRTAEEVGELFRQSNFGHAGASVRYEEEGIAFSMECRKN